ncbi:MAG: hypothetical protein GXP35_01220 [Actinobacteria bacterium]|nr:hypothetical protein [Actinomycetota bacterium]
MSATSPTNVGASVTGGDSFDVGTIVAGKTVVDVADVAVRVVEDVSGVRWALRWVDSLVSIVAASE